MTILVTETRPPVKSSRPFLAHALEASIRIAREMLASRSLLLWPSILPLVIFFIVPVAVMLHISFLPKFGGDTADSALTLNHYIRFLSEPLFRQAFVKTLSISTITCAAAVLVGYPIALAIIFGRPWQSKLLTIVVILPLFVNVVVRGYGWRVLLGRQGVINTALIQAGLIDSPLDLLYSDFAVILGSLHVFLPLLVLPIVASLERIDRRLIDASTCLGASISSTFFLVIFPLSLPGLAAGLALVFSSTASSFVMPALLGGDFTKMLGNLAEEQILSVFDWPFGATIAVFMMMTIGFFLLTLVPLTAYDRRWKRS